MNSLNDKVAIIWKLVNQMIGFYMMTTLAFNELIHYVHNVPLDFNVSHYSAALKFQCNS